MKNKQNIAIVGDIHGDWGPLNIFLNKKRPDIILQCGDFGWWRPFHDTDVMSQPSNNYKKKKKWNQYGLKLHGNSKLYWCDGNHEHHDDLDKNFTNLTNEVMHNIFFMRRGSTLTLPNGKVVLFIGGAESIDSEYRILGRDWFQQESISYRDIDNLPNCHVDWIVSHTAPYSFGMGKKYEFVSSSQHALDMVIEKYRPEKWWFGHFHTFKKGEVNGCKWTALNCMGETGGFEIFSI